MYKVIAKEEHFVVISKDAGVSFHSEGLVSKIKEDLGLALFPVHRLDEVTSGLLLFAKSSEAAKELSALFSEKKIKKTYLALSDSKPAKKQGMIKGDIEKTRNGSYKLTRKMENPSQTRFQSFKLDSMKKTRLFLLYPITGKTHQIRVVMKSLGSPILGDARYGKEPSDRCYLHCYQLEFTLYEKTYNFKCYPDSGINFVENKKIIEEVIDGKSI